MIKKNKLGILLGALLATFLMISTGVGQPAGSQTQQEQPKTEKPAQTVKIDGKVSAVSETSVTVVDGKKMEKTIAIDANTKVMKGGKEATLADIKADDAVSVVAKAEGDVLTAISIKIA